MPSRHAGWSVRGDLLIFFDALRVKIRKDMVACNKALCLAQGVLPDGTLACDNQQRRALTNRKRSVKVRQVTRL